MSLFCPKPHYETALLMQEGAAWLVAFKKWPSRQYIDQAVSLYMRSQGGILGDIHDRVRCCRALAGALMLRYDHYHSKSDLTFARTISEQVMDFLPIVHYERTLSQLSLCWCIQRGWNAHIGQVDDMDLVSVLADEILRQCRPGHPLRSAALENLAYTEMFKYTLTQDGNTLEHAIELNTILLVLHPPGDHARPRTLFSLSSALSLRFRRTGDQADLRRAIRLSEEGKRCLPPSEISQPLSTFPPSIATLQRSCKIDLGIALGKLYNSSRDLEVLALCIHTWEEVLEGSDLADGRIVCIAGLTLALTDLFDQTGDITAARRAIELQKLALTLVRPPHRDFTTFLRMLASLLKRCYVYGNDPSDLQEADTYCRDLLSIPTEDKFQHIQDLHLHAEVLTFRYRVTHDPRDIEVSAQICSQILEFQADDGDEEMAATVLEMKTQMMFLDLPSELLLTLMRTTKGTIRSRGNDILMLEVEAAVYRLWYDKTGELNYLDRSEELYTQMIARLPENDHRGANALQDLALIYGERAQRDSNIPSHGTTTLDQAIQLATAALCHPGLLESKRPFVKASLSVLLERRYCDLNDAHSTTQLILARDLVRDVALTETGPIDTRFFASLSWATVAKEINAYDSAMEAYRVAFQLLPRLAWLGNDTRASMHALRQQTSARLLIVDAAMSAVSQSQIETAVEFLEAGRSILWTQAAFLRTPVDELEAQAPKLAMRVRHLSRLLERGGSRQVSDIHGSGRFNFDLNVTGDPLAAGSTRGNTNWKIRQEWLNVLQETRRIPGFEHFLSHKPYRLLSEVSRDGPVVILLPHPRESVAIIIESVNTKPVCIRLPISSDKLLRAQDMMQGLMSSRGMDSDMIDRCPQDDERAGRKKTRHLTSGSLLEMLWEDVARPVVEYLTKGVKPQNMKERKRLWWCCVDCFSFLPIHAAGVYSFGQKSASKSTRPPTCVSDFFISSYIPSLETLLRVRQRQDLSSSSSQYSTSNIKILAAIQPKGGPGFPPLPHTKDELKAIYEVVPKDNIISLQNSNTPGPDLEGQHTTITNITSQLPKASILHLACHAIVDSENPLQTAFILRDGERLTVDRLMQDSPLPNAYMAFLSACETAASDVRQPDEAISLSAAMLFAGFRTVAATMWPMGDPDGPAIARSVYSQLFAQNEDSGSKTRRTLVLLDEFCLATALDAAVRELRERIPSQWERWATFIHIGV